MRIAIVHSFYSRDVPSGENSIVDMSVQTLLAAGHDVEVFARHTDDLQHSSLYELKSGLRVATGIGASPSRELRVFNPEIVHVHNLFPNFGTRWLKEWRDRLVSTIHNFRPICANGLLFRDGHVCLECPGGSQISSLRHACYRDSRAATLPITARNFGGLHHDPVFSQSARIIVLSDMARDIFSRFGGALERMVVVANGVPVNQQLTAGRSNGRWLAVGRLTAEKGIAELARCWPESLSLDIVGDGPLADEIRAAHFSSVNLLGPLERGELLATMQQYEGLVFPSVCLEMQPTSVIEAMAVGLPVVALAGNAGADLVTRFGAGQVYSGPDDLEHQLLRASQNRGALASAGQTAYRRLYAPERWLSTIERLYTRVTEEAKGIGAS